MANEPSHPQRALAVHPARLFAGSCFGVITGAVQATVIYTIAETLKDRFALNNQQIGSIAGASLWGCALAMMVCGSLCDVLGMKRLVRLGLLAHLSGTLMMICAKGFPLLFAGALTISIGDGLLQAAYYPLVATIYSNRKTEMFNKLLLWYPGGRVLSGLALYAFSCFDSGSAAMPFLGLEFWQWKLGLIFLPTLGYAALYLGRTFPPPSASSRALPSARCAARRFSGRFLAAAGVHDDDRLRRVGAERLGDAGLGIGRHTRHSRTGMDQPVDGDHARSGRRDRQSHRRADALARFGGRKRRGASLVERSAYVVDGRCGGHGLRRRRLLLLADHAGYDFRAHSQGRRAALTLMSGVGMLAVGVITTPLMGRLADYHAHEQLPTSETAAALQQVIDTYAVSDAKRQSGQCRQEAGPAIEAARTALAALATQGQLPRYETAHALRLAAAVDRDSAAAKQAESILRPADNYGGRMSFRWTSLLSVALC